MAIDNEKKIWDFLMSKIGNPFGVAGLMGNLYAESGLKPTNLQNSYEKKLGMTDDVYTSKVDSGEYDNFVKDAAGYGLAQWTYWSRKQAMLDYAKSKGKSIGDLDMQLEFLLVELNGYKTVLSTLKKAKSVKEASDVVLTQFERPADQSDKVKEKRASFGQTYYDKYNNVSATPVKPKEVYDRINVVEIMRSWLGRKESDGSHKPIIDEYNKIAPLPSGYKLKYTDAWCAGCVSAAFHVAGYDSIFPSECSCSRMIEKAKKMGIWEENDAYVPKIGDCVIYDWQDNGIGDNVGNPDHVGIVTRVTSSNMTVIEGNYSDSVKERVLAINGKFIRGFVLPKFNSESEQKTSQNCINIAYAQNLDKSLAGTYKVTASSLMLRNAPGTSAVVIRQMPRDTKIKMYGYYTTYIGEKWFLIQCSDGQTGFCHSGYLRKM